MHKLYQAADRIQAQMLKDFLADHSVDAVILGDFLSGAAGELPATIFPEVWVVEEADSGYAEELLQRFLDGPRTGENPLAWTCAACGEIQEAQFLSCWKCGTPRP